MYDSPPVEVDNGEGNTDGEAADEVEVIDLDESTDEDASLIDLGSGENLIPLAANVDVTVTFHSEEA